MLLVSTAATFNIVQNYVTDSLTKRVYGRKPEYGQSSSSHWARVPALACYS